MSQGSLFQYVLDSSSVIEIERRGRISLLRTLRNFIIVPEKVAKEIRQPGSRLERFLNRYPEIITRLNQEEQRRYLEIRSQREIHDAEASAIAVALNRKHTLVIEDKKARSKAENHGVKCQKWNEVVK